MNMERKVVTNMKASSRLFLPVPASRRTLRASLERERRGWGGQDSISYLLCSPTFLAAPATPMAASKSMLAPVKYSLATSPVFSRPSRGRRTRGRREVTSRGRTSVHQNKAIRQMQLPHLTICRSSV